MYRFNILNILCTCTFHVSVVVIVGPTKSCSFAVFIDVLFIIDI